jgi:hypothetical protein
VSRRIGLWIVLVGSVLILGIGAGLEARSLRRDERRARLPELVSDHAAGLVDGRRYGADASTPTVAKARRERLRAALAASGECLPACEALLVSC